MGWRHEVRLTRNGGSIVSYLESIFSLRGKNALVTGAASGLGRRCAVFPQPRRASPPRAWPARSAGEPHTHAHEHEALTHSHPHMPDMHHARH
jgi:hypothetical protein